MPRKPLTEEQKQIMRERLAKARQAQKEKREAAQAVEAAKEQQAPEQPAPTASFTNDSYEDMQRQINELKALLVDKTFAQLAGQQTASPQVNDRGRLIGSQERYSLERYPDPRKRLANEPALQRFAFKDNYELHWEQTTVQYENIDGVRMREPRFLLELWRIVYDDDTGERTDQRYTVCRMFLHEDPEAALATARQHNLHVDEADQTSFLNEMRYLRMRDWLTDAFMTPKRSQPKQDKKEIAIGGKIVEVFTVNSENSASIPFDQLRTKV